MSRMSKKLRSGEPLRDQEARQEAQRQQLLGQQSVRSRAFGNRQQHCEGKSPLTEPRAIRIAMRQQAEGSVNSRAYPCPACTERMGWAVWHIGHKARASHTVFDRRQRPT
jgi:hypothetical protein